MFDSNHHSTLPCNGYSHTRKFEKKCQSTEFKTLLTRAVKSFVEPVKNRLAEQDRMARDNISFDDDLEPSWKYERLENAKFTMYNEVKWDKKHSSNDMKVKIRKTGRELYSWPGPATVFKFEEKHYPSVEELAALRKVSSDKSVGLHRGRPCLGMKRPMSLSISSQNAEEDSSSGSEDEEVEMVLSGNKAARRNTEPCRISSFGNAVASQHHRRAWGGNDASGSTKIKRLEQRVQSLQSQLQEARAELMQSRAHNDLADRYDAGIVRLQESLEHALQQNAFLKKERQEAENRQASQISKLKEENERLRLELDEGRGYILTV
jgi:hypothetical protein